MAGSPDPSSRGSNTARNLKKVVVSAGRRPPRVALIGGDLELRGTAVGIDDLRAEPVLRDAGLHVDLERARDVRARYVIPGQVDDSLGFIGEGFKGVGEKVEMVVTAARAFVNDLLDM